MIVLYTHVIYSQNKYIEIVLKIWMENKSTILADGPIIFTCGCNGFVEHQIWHMDDQTV